jgi:hypothetical protein
MYKTFWQFCKTEFFFRWIAANKKDVIYRGWKIKRNKNVIKVYLMGSVCGKKEKKKN